MDALRSAYAMLELDPTASPREVRRQFKKLVRRWHPDRFAQDPQGQAEASRRMQQINAAYELILASGTASSAPAEPGPAYEPHVPRERQESHGRLSRSEIDKLVSSIGTTGPVDVFLEIFAWSWPLVGAFCVIGPDVVRGRFDPRPVVWPPRYWWLALLLIGLAALLRFEQYWRRR